MLASVMWSPCVEAINSSIIIYYVPYVLLYPAVPHKCFFCRYVLFLTFFVVQTVLGEPVKLKLAFLRSNYLQIL